MNWFKKKSTEEQRAIAWMEAQTEVHRRYLAAMAPLLEKLLTSTNPAMDPARRAEDQRDYFAAAALSGYWGQPDEALPSDHTPESYRAMMAQEFYKWADAMLAARCK